MRENQKTIIIQINEGEIGVPLGVLASRIRVLLRVLRELDIQMSEDQKKTSRWVVTGASYNSPLTLTIASVSLRGRTANPDIVKTFVEGVKTIQKSPSEPPYFTPDILKTTKKLMESKDGLGGDITISTPGGPRVKTSKKLTKNINAVLRSRHYKEYGTIEGKLDTIDIHGKRVFQVYDALTDHATACHFKSDLSTEARDALGCRVAVTGMITFNRQDIPFHMSVDGISRFGEPRKLPLFLEGEGLDITGGIDSVEYVRRGRDAE